MNRPVWLFSLDTEQFCAPPMTTGGLKAYFLRYGRTAERTDVKLIHFRQREEIEPWLRDRWDAVEASRAREAASRGLTPVVGFSVYTWNAAELLEAVAHVRRTCPEALVVAGGPHVQRAEDYLHEDGIDAVVLGEGEETFQHLLDAPDRKDWHAIEGLAFVGADGEVVRTPARARRTELDALPSALDVIALRDGEGRPKYERVAYETSRGCPFRCSFCEWGTGAIGTKMYQFGLDRIRSDFERLIEGGIQDIWLCDSNFGALREDLDKARIIVELRERTGRPSTFQTSWSKNHNQRVQEIVLLLHRHGLLHHYNLALQTLTPEALRLSNRRNMRSNQYEPVAKAMAAEGVPIATELIWGLPGDNLADFDRNLDELAAVFPNINIFGYTLLPGTEFYDRRQEYRIETIPVAGYGKAKGEYVVGCHTFDRDEGIEGYFLITAHILLIRGYVMPLTARLVALDGSASVSALLRGALRALVEAFAPDMPDLDLRDRMTVYENRDRLYLTMLGRAEETFALLRHTVARWLRDGGADEAGVARALATLELDEAFCPRVGPSTLIEPTFSFAADRVLHHLGRMEPPAPADFAPGPPLSLSIRHPGHVGEVLRDPDGGSWMRGQLRSPPETEVDPELPPAPVTNAAPSGYPPATKIG